MENIESYRVVLWIMMSCQMIAWGWFSHNGGKLNDRKFYIFTFGMIIGQTGATIETILQGAWGTCTVQIFFFIFTAYGGLKRLHQSKKNIETNL